MAEPRAEASHGPPQQEWERYKDKIIDLYLRTSLKDVMSEMEKHGFHANKRMYSLRFKQWKVKKNRTAAEKKGIAQRIVYGDQVSSRDRQRAQRHMATKSRNNPISDQIGVSNITTASPDHRAAQNRRDQYGMQEVDMHNIGQNEARPDNSAHIPIPGPSGAQDSIGVRQPSAETGVRLVFDDLDGDTAGGRMRALVLPTHPSHTPVYEASQYRELVLSCVSAYYHGRLDSMTEHEQAQDILKFGSSAKSEKFWSNIKNGIYLRKISAYFPDNHARSSTAFEEAHALISDALTTVPLDFMCELLATLSTINTRACPEVRVEFLDHLERQSTRMFGQRHPISVLCAAMKHPDGDSVETSRSGLICILNIFSERLGPSHQGVYRIMDWLSTLMRRNGEYEQARVFGEDALKLARRDHGPTAHPTRAAAISLSRTVTKLGQYERALELCLEVVQALEPNQQQSIRIESDENADKLSLSAMEDIAEYYSRTRKIKEAILWLRRAEKVSRRLLGEDKATEHISDKLDELLNGNLEGQVADGVVFPTQP